MASQIFKMAACRPQNRSNRENQKKALGVLPKGILTPSIIEIAPAVTKRALLTDDDGRRISTAISHVQMKHSIFSLFTLFSPYLRTK
jgi:hypothetical protein